MIGKIRLPRMNELEQIKEKARMTVRVDLKVFRSDVEIYKDGNHLMPNPVRVDKVSPRLLHREFL